MTIGTCYSISVSQQDDSFTCGLHVAKKMLAFMNINSTRSKKSIELPQWKISDFGSTRNYNAFIKNKNIDNIFFKDNLCDIHPNVERSAFPHLDNNYLLNTKGVNDIKDFLLVIKCEMRCLLYRILLLWNRKVFDELTKTSNTTTSSHDNFLDENRFNIVDIENRVLAYTNLQKFQDHLVGNHYEKF